MVLRVLRVECLRLGVILQVFRRAVDGLVAPLAEVVWGLGFRV